MKGKVVMLEVVFSVPLKFGKGPHGKSINSGVSGCSLWPVSWLADWNLSERKIVLGKDWRLNKWPPLLIFKNSKILGDGFLFFDHKSVESVRDCKNNKILYPDKI